MGLFSAFKPTKEVHSNNHLWDQQLFRKLVEDTDDVTAGLIWQSFRNALATSLKEWKTAAAAGDYVPIRQIAHKTRSSSLLLGFREFASLSQRIEQHLADPSTGGEITADLNQWMDQARNVLEILGQQPPELARQQSDLAGP
jgi:HPt (histidine-containing phosphotransfer) domain-containing protein